jgi:hypothetical protein
MAIASKSERLERYDRLAKHYGGRVDYHLANAVSSENAAHSGRYPRMAAYHSESSNDKLERALFAERQAAKYADLATRVRSKNPSGGGVSLLGLALGAVLGAAALHFTMHRKP